MDGIKLIFPSSYTSQSLVSHSFTQPNGVTIQHTHTHHFAICLCSGPCLLHWEQLGSKESEKVSLGSWVSNPASSSSFSPAALLSIKRPRNVAPSADGLSPSIVSPNIHFHSHQCVFCSLTTLPFFLTNVGAQQEER